MTKAESKIMAALVEAVKEAIPVLEAAVECGFYDGTPRSTIRYAVENHGTLVKLRQALAAAGKDGK